MIESPVLDEVKEILRKQYTTEARVSTLRENVLANLEARFGAVPAERLAVLNAVTDEGRLKTLLRLAATCPSVDTFVADLTTGN